MWIGVIITKIVSFPYEPFYFLNLDAETYGKGNTYLFSKNASCIYHNPALIAKIPRHIFVTGVYENRTFPGLFPDSEKEILRIPQFLGLIFPFNQKISIGCSFAYLYERIIEFFPILVWSKEKNPLVLQDLSPYCIMRKSLTRKIEMRSFLFGSGYKVFPHFYTGISVHIITGEADIPYIFRTLNNENRLGIERYEMNALQLIWGSLITFNNITTLAIKLDFPCILGGKMKKTESSVGEVLVINDTFPFNVSCGISIQQQKKHTLNIQLSYKNWTNEHSYFRYSPEYGGYLGKEIRIRENIFLKAGFYLQYFPKFISQYQFETPTIGFLTTGITKKQKSFRFSFSFGYNLFIKHYPSRRIIVIGSFYNTF